MLVVSGRAAAAAGGFGGDAVRRSICAINSPLHPRVCSTRLYHLARVLEAAAAEMQDRLTRLRLENQSWELRRKAALEASERKRALFDQAIRAAVDLFLERAERKIQAYGEDVASGITPASLDRGDEYGRALTGKLHLAVEEGLADLTDRVRKAAGESRQILSDALWGELKALTAPEPVFITVPRHGAEARARLFGENAAAGAAVDRLLGLSAAALKSVEKEVAEAKETARAAARTAAQASKDRGTTVGRVIGSGADALKTLGKNVSGVQENARAAARMAAEALQDRGTMVGRVIGSSADALKTFGNDLSKVRENARGAAQRMQEGKAAAGRLWRSTVAGRWWGSGTDALKALEKELSKVQDKARTLAQSVVELAADVMTGFEQDVIETQGMVREAARAAAAGLQNRRDSTVQMLLRHAAPIRSLEEAPAAGLAEEAKVAGWLLEAAAIRHETEDLLSAAQHECDRH